MRRSILGLWVVLGMAIGACNAQTAMPGTVGETLSGKRLSLVDAVRGHQAVLVVGFSHEAGDGCGAWVKAIHADAALSGTVVYEAAMLEKAPGFIRGVIKGGMRKGLSPAEQDAFVVFTQDEKQWRDYFGVNADKDPYVVLLDAQGKIKWTGHGNAKDLEPQLKAAAQ